MVAFKTKLSLYQMQAKLYFQRYTHAINNNNNKKMPYSTKQLKYIYIAYVYMILHVSLCFIENAMREWDEKSERERETHTQTSVVGKLVRK